ncbi:MAG: hypothetical protein JO041_14395, partial [Acidobacteria bacterium]|nr:hypothetical protein [Acidobacteriota bacterium]
MSSTVSCEVQLHGTDGKRQPFSEPAMVSAVALHYVELAKLPGSCRAGQIVTLEYSGRKRRYIISATRADGSARLEALNAAPSIFPAALLNGDESLPSFWHPPDPQLISVEVAAITPKPTPLASKRPNTRR